MAVIKVRGLNSLGISAPIEGADEGLISSLRIGTSGSNTLLTKAILDTLTSGGDASSLHHHDGRYYTETELFSSTSGSSGATLIKGDNKAYSNISGLTSYTMQDFLDRINAALGSAGSSDFSDATFRISDDGDATKKIAFEASAITTSTVRTISMPDANVNLADANNAILKDGSRTFTAAQSMGGFKLTSVANGTASGDAVNYSQLQAIQSMIQNFEWQASVLDRAITPPGSPSEGDRYLIDGSLGTATGAWAGQENKIAQYVSAAWVFTSPTVGMFTAADDEPTALYLYGGASWSAKYFESTTASTGLTKVGFDIRLDSSAAGDGLGFSSGVLSVNVDNTTIELNTDALRLKAGGIQDSHVNAGSTLYEAITFFSNTNMTGAEAETLSDGSNADSLHKHRDLFATFTNNTGSTIAAGSVVMLSQSVAGEIALADASAIASCEAIAGVVPSSIANGASGLVQIAGVCAPVQDAAFDLGKRVYVSETAGSSTKTAPSTSGSVIFLVGEAVSTTQILLNKQLVALN
jgi:hypothetical protein